MFVAWPAKTVWSNGKVIVGCQRNDPLFFISRHALEKKVGFWGQRGLFFLLSSEFMNGVRGHFSFIERGSLITRLYLCTNATKMSISLACLVTEKLVCWWVASHPNIGLIVGRVSVKSSCQHLGVKEATDRSTLSWQPILFIWELRITCDITLLL